MRQTVKIIAILGMLVSLFPAYSMKPGQEQGQRDGFFYHIFAPYLKNQEPLKPVLGLQYSGNLQPVDTDDSICSDKGLALIFSAAKFIMGSDRLTEEETLRMIKKAVCEGENISIYSNYTVSVGYDFSKICPTKFFVFPEDEPISIFKSISGLFGPQDLLLSKGKNPHMFGKRKEWMKAVFEGQRERDKKFGEMSSTLITHTHDLFKIHIPKDIIFCILLQLQGDGEGKRRELIKKAKQEFDAE